MIHLAKPQVAIASSYHHIFSLEIGFVLWDFEKEEDTRDDVMCENYRSDYYRLDCGLGRSCESITSFFSLKKRNF